MCANSSILYKLAIMLTASLIGFRRRQLNVYKE